MSAGGDGLERTANSGRRPDKLNLGASIQARLKNHAKDRGEDMRYVLARYVVERFLYRLSVSPYANGFVLRGATLFAIWNDTGAALFRPTRDLDMLATGEHSIEEYRTCLTTILGWEVPGDGVAFLPETLRMEERVAGRAYPGLSAVAIATVGTARPRLEIDIAFGEAVWPAPEIVELPSLLDQPRPILRAYPRETVVAEKAHALVELGRDNTRLKDYFDIVFLAQNHAFDGTTLQESLHATFSRRGTALPLAAVPEVLAGAFSSDPAKQRFWTALRQRMGADCVPAQLDAVVSRLEPFLAPVLVGSVAGMVWEPGGPWTFAKPSENPKPPNVS